MHGDHDDPQGTPDTEPLSVESIRESFQKVLDALDAARADLYRSDPWGLRDGQGRGAPSGAAPGAEAEAGTKAHAQADADRPGARARSTFEDLIFFRREVAWGAGDAPAPASPPVPVEPLWARNAPAPEPSSAARPETGCTPEAPAWPEEIRVTAGAARGWGPWRGAPGRRRRPPLGRRGQLAGVCGVGAVGGLIVASSLLADGRLVPGGPVPSVQPDRPLPVGTDAGPAGAPRGWGAPADRIRVVSPGTDGGAGGRYTVEVRVAEARFQDPAAQAGAGASPVRPQGPEREWW
ncbi:hypothetical protein [Streptomyces purpureus]|uniref:Uncharacterized protein n=1 Tax=Streptomyces purpureus TaxID=1951 RepID=A0A918GWH9_9ACTN|nr:hypothetical protein [Streptomyces purpureus]GGT14085.1 hypothetical protein GCM10014713_03350 [Streptomyces purpureus]